MSFAFPLVSCDCRFSSVSHHSSRALRTIIALEMQGDTVVNASYRTPLDLLSKLYYYSVTKREDIGAEEGGVGNISSTSVRKSVVWCWHPLCYGVVKL